MKAAITGAGLSDIGRSTQRPAMAHLAQAAQRALALAGLSRDDIDGICTYPGKTNNAPGQSPLGTGEVRNALGLTTRWHCAVPDGPSVPKADIRLTMTSDDLLALTDGQLNFGSAWASGRVKLEAGLRDLLRLRKIL